MTSNLEKIFMNWIFKNPEHFKIVEPFFFENEDIQVVYRSVRDEYIKSKDKEVPKTTEIINLVKLADKNDKIATDLIRAILKVNFDDFREEFIVPRFNAWVLAHSTINGLVNGIEDIKDVDKTDYEAVTLAVGKIKVGIEDAVNVQLDKGNLGVDFDDPDAHNQETLYNKITTGYPTMDGIMDGGFDRKTFNVLMGGPGSGKSLWLQNFAVNAANAGYNVAYITLELSDVKALKRIGAMRLEIPIADYAELSKDREYIKSKIQEMNARHSTSMFEDTKPGKLLIREYPSGSATASDIESYLKLVKEMLGIDIDMLVVDYIQIMACEKGIDRNMLYLKGDHLAVSLRALGQKRNMAVLTATQIAKDKYNANDIFLNDMPESKAIADTADTVWAIIQTAPMKMEGKYHLKHLKLRDSSTDYERLGFEFDKRYLKVGNDRYIESIL